MSEKYDAVNRRPTSTCGSRKEKGGGKFGGMDPMVLGHDTVEHF